MYVGPAVQTNAAAEPCSTRAITRTLKDVPKKKSSVEAAMITNPATNGIFFALHRSTKAPTNTVGYVRNYTLLRIRGSYMERLTRLPHKPLGEWMRRLALI
jgi:hypothetical protein